MGPSSLPVPCLPRSAPLRAVLRGVFPSASSSFLLAPDGPTCLYSLSGQAEVGGGESCPRHCSSNSYCGRVWPYRHGCVPFKSHLSRTNQRLVTTLLHNLFFVEDSTTFYCLDAT